MKQRDHDVQAVPINTRRQSTWKAQQSQEIIATCQRQRATRENGLSLSRGRQYSLSLSDREGRRNDRYAAAMTVYVVRSFAICGRMKPPKLLSWYLKIGRTRGQETKVHAGHPPSWIVQGNP